MLGRARAASSDKSEHYGLVASVNSGKCLSPRTMQYLRAGPHLFAGVAETSSPKFPRAASVRASRPPQLSAARQFASITSRSLTGGERQGARAPEDARA